MACRGSETDLGSGGGVELRGRAILCLGADRSRFLTSGGPPGTKCVWKPTVEKKGPQFNGRKDT